MEPNTPPQPTPEPRKTTHTYQSDLERAMDTTEVAAVQELLATARAKETYDLERAVATRQRKWYTTGAVILLLLGVGAVAFGIYYYRTLTVPVAPSPGVGVFQSATPIHTDTTPLASLIHSLADQAIPEGKPIMIPFVDAQGSMLSTDALLSYLDTHMSEPFIATLSLARYGVYNTGSSISPFFILSTQTPELATKELLIAEPTLLSQLAPSLGIDLTLQTRDIDPAFESTYMFNVPVRTLHSTNIDTHERTILLYYGYATENTIVIATNPSVLKSVYDTIIRQR